MKSLFRIWVVISSVVTIVVIAREVMWELRPNVAPDAQAIADEITAAVNHRIGESEFDHEFVTELNVGSELVRMHDANLDPSPTLTVGYRNAVSITCINQALEPGTSSRDAFLRLCDAAAYWRIGGRNWEFEQWISAIADGEESNMLHLRHLLIWYDRTPTELRINIY